MSRATVQLRRLLQRTDHKTMKSPGLNLTRLRHLIIQTRPSPTPHTRTLPPAPLQLASPPRPSSTSALSRHQPPTSQQQQRQLHRVPHLLATTSRSTVAAAARRMSTTTTDLPPTSTPPQHASTHTSEAPNHTTSADASHPHPPPPTLAPLHSSNHDDLAATGTRADTITTAAASSGSSPPLPPLPALPAAPAHNDDGATTTTTLQVDGKAVILDHLGPMVVGRDGTVSRIANWDELSDIERRNTLRVLGKRNQVRLAALRGEGNGASEGKAV